MTSLFLIGDWYKDDFCDEQNQLSLQQNGDYLLLESNNTDCELNQTYTLKSTGTYSYIGNELIFSPEETIVIDLGDDDITPDITLVNEEIWEFNPMGEVQFTGEIISRNGIPIEGSPSFQFTKAN